MSTASESSDSIVWRGGRSSPRATSGRPSRGSAVLARRAGEQVGEPAGAAGAALALARAQRGCGGRFGAARRHGGRGDHPGDVGAAARLRLGTAAAVGGHRLLAHDPALRRGRDRHRLGATHGRIGGVEAASMAGDDAVELGQRLDLIDDDAAHLGGALGGLLRQLEDALAQLGAGGFELALHLRGHALEPVDHVGEALCRLGEHGVRIAGGALVDAAHAPRWSACSAPRWSRG